MSPYPKSYHYNIRTEAREADYDRAPDTIREEVEIDELCERIDHLEHRIDELQSRLDYLTEPRS